MAESISVYTVARAGAQSQSAFNQLIGFKDSSNRRLRTIPTPEADDMPIVGDIEERVIPFGSEYIERMAGFVDRFLLGGVTYDCHTFAFTMAGEDVDHVSAPERARSLVRSGMQHREFLALGQIGTIGGFNLVEGRRPTPDHSIFGLGSGLDLCLEVNRINGQVGLNRYQAVYSRLMGGLWNMMRLENVKAYNLYVAEK